MSFELTIGDQTKLCSMHSSRHHAQTWTQEQLKHYAQQNQIPVKASCSKSQLCEAIHKALAQNTGASHKTSSPIKDA